MKNKAESTIDDFEIDLIELMQHIFKLRYHMISGALVCTVIYLIYVSFVQIPKTKIQVFADIDPASLPAIVEEKELTKALENVFTDRGLSQKTYTDLKAKYPEFMSSFDSNSDFMSLIPNPTNDNQSSFATVRGSTVSFQFQPHYLQKWSQEFFLDLLNSTIKSYNIKRTNLVRVQIGNDLLHFQNILVNLRDKSAENTKIWQKNLADLQFELTQLEFELFKKLQQTSGKTYEELKQYRQEIYNHPSEPSKTEKETFSEEVRQNLIRLASALSNTGIIKEDMLTRISQKIVESRFLEDQLKTNFQIENSAQTGALNRFAEAYSKKSIGILPEKELVPLFTIQQKSENIVATKTNGFNGLTLVFTIILGSMLGLGLGLIQNYRRAKGTIVPSPL